MAAIAASTLGLASSQAAFATSTFSLGANFLSGCAGISPFWIPSARLAASFAASVPLYWLATCLYRRTIPTLSSSFVRAEHRAPHDQEHRRAPLRRGAGHPRPTHLQARPGRELLAADLVDGRDDVDHRHARQGVALRHVADEVAEGLAEAGQASLGVER